MHSILKVIVDSTVRYNDYAYIQLEGKLLQYKKLMVQLTAKSTSTTFDQVVLKYFLSSIERY